jgi:hypothetical protein
VTVERQRIQHGTVITDHVAVPRVALHGTYNFGDMLSAESVQNLWTVYNQLQKG